MIKNVTIDRDVSVKSTLDSIYTDLYAYASQNIPDYDVITEIPKEHMDYINSVKYAVSCGYMFADCTSLETLNLSNFNTSLVTDMGNMFYACTSLNLLDLTNFNTNNVTNMSYMFSGCMSLQFSDLNIFDTRNVTSMNNMFERCQSLTSLNLSDFNISKVTYMNYMFSYCNNLTTLDLSNWNTSNVTDMTGLFNECLSLTTIKGTVDLSSCKSVHSMFTNTKKLKGVHFKNVPRSLLDGFGLLGQTKGTFGYTYYIDNILEDK